MAGKGRYGWGPTSYADVSHYIEILDSFKTHGAAEYARLNDPWGKGYYISLLDQAEKVLRDREKHWTPPGAGDLRSALKNLRDTLSGGAKRSWWRMW